MIKMKKILIFTCAGIAVLLISIGTLNLKKRFSHTGTIQFIDTTLYITHIALDSPSIKDMPVLKFAETRYDFGIIKKNTQIVVHFEFLNEGNAPLVILKIDVSCGCLSAEYPKQPTEPNEKGILKISVDTRGITGVFNKTLFVKSNAVDDVILLRIVGQIK